MPFVSDHFLGTSDDNDFWAESSVLDWRDFMRVIVDENNVMTGSAMTCDLTSKPNSNSIMLSFSSDLCTKKGRWSIDR